MKKLYLVDVSSMYFRAFYAIRPLTNKSGMPTNALYGFLSMSVKLLKELKPDYMAYCFDRKEPSFRKDIYEGYKAHRSDMPEDLVPQVPYVRKISEALGIACFDQKGFEADDLIGSFTELAKNKNVEVIIVSGDKDFAQLVGPHVVMYDTMKDIKYDVPGVIEKWGVDPSQVIDYMALVGDSSDNIPGVRGIGPKGAQKLIAEFKTLENLYENLSQVKNESLRKKLEANKENAFLSKTLVKIKCDINLGIGLEDLRLKPLPEQQLKDLLEELDFKSFEKKIFATSMSPTASAVASAETSAASKTKASEPVVSPDEPSEQTSFKMIPESEGTEIPELTHQVLQKILSSTEAVMGWSSDRGEYVASGEGVFRIPAERAEFAQAFNKAGVKWRGYDLKTFWHRLYESIPQEKLNLSAVWDSKIAAYVVRAGDVGELEECYLKMTGKALNDLPTPNDICIVLQELESNLRERIANIKAEKLLNNIELPLVSVLYKMERRGIKVDVKALQKQSQDLLAEIASLEKKIFELTGHTFSIASTKQLADVLFNKLKMPPIRKTKTGFSTDSDVLEKLSKEYPVCLSIIEYRELTKLKSTYLDALPQLVHPQDGRLHTSFHQALTATGRLSSTNPNLQNIPIRTPRGAKVREAFTVEEGCVLLSADYSQIELRVLAHITEDPGLIAAFESDLDIHAATASEVFDKKLNEVTPEMRRVAKAVNFGIAYGMGSFGLSENLGISIEEANSIISKYFGRFKKVRDYMSEIVEKAKSQGYVETILGRRRYLEELKSKNGNIRKFGERAAINAPMQGTASDIVKVAMLEVEKVVPDSMLLQVHDELIFELPKANAKKQGEIIKSTMESVVKLRVPLKVNVAIGNNWDDAH